MSALIGENVHYRKKSFDGFWLSSLTHATSKAKPDIEYVDDTTTSQSIIEIFDAKKIDEEKITKFEKLDCLIIDNY